MSANMQTCNIEMIDCVQISFKSGMTYLVFCDVVPATNRLKIGKVDQRVNFKYC